MTAKLIPFPRNPRTILAEREHAEKVAAWQERCEQFELVERTWKRVAELVAEEDRALELRLAASVRRERMRGVMRGIGRKLRAK